MDSDIVVTGPFNSTLLHATVQLAYRRVQRGSERGVVKARSRVGGGLLVTRTFYPSIASGIRRIEKVLLLVLPPAEVSMSTARGTMANNRWHSSSNTC